MPFNLSFFMSAKTVLGRGLGSLIPQKKSFTEAVLPGVTSAVHDLDPALIRPNPHQPRVLFDPEELEDLAASIKQHGILVPLVVTRAGGAYELVAGERRLRAAKMVGLSTVPAIVRDADEQQKLEWAIIENVQRQELNAVEEAYAYRALLDEFNVTQEEVARRVGKSRSAVANTVRLLDLPEEMLRALQEGQMTKSHARALLSETDLKKRAALFADIQAGRLSTRVLEQQTSGRLQKRGGTHRDANLLAQEARLREKYGTRVTIAMRGGRGSLRFDVYSPEDLQELVRRLEQG